MGCTHHILFTVLWKDNNVCSRLNLRLLHICTSNDIKQQKKERYMCIKLDNVVHYTPIIS